MAPYGRVPPISEAGFRREYLLIWTIAGACCLIIGLVIGPRFSHARNSWLAICVALSVYLFSVLLCRVVLMSIWRRPLVTPAVLYFSLPVGAMALTAVLVMNWLSVNISIGMRTLRGLALSMGLLYVASLIWAVGIGIRRKQMGDFDVEDRG
jgi:hypothetical protein